MRWLQEDDKGILIFAQGCQPLQEFNKQLEYAKGWQPLPQLMALKKPKHWRIGLLNSLAKMVNYHTHLKI